MSLNMKIITIVVVVIVVVFVVDSQQAEIYCPRGWIIQGQVIFKNATDYTPASMKYAMCLICRINSFAVNPFGTVEVCIYFNNELMQQDFYSRSLKICGYDYYGFQKINNNFNEICSTMYSSPACGISIFLKNGFNEALETIKFLSCNQTNLIPIQPQLVDIQCPKNWKFGGIEQQKKIYYFNRRKDAKLPSKTLQESCLVCNSTKLQNTEQQIFYCTASLDLFLLDFAPFVAIEKRTKIKREENPNITNSSNSSIYKLSFVSNKYQFNEDNQIEELSQEFIKEKDRKEDPEVNYSSPNVSFKLFVVVFAIIIEIIKNIFYTII
jgi:hypothetical protein